METINIKIYIVDQQLSCWGLNIIRYDDVNDAKYYKLATKAGEVVGKIQLTDHNIKFEEFNGPLNISLDNDRSVTIEDTNLFELIVTNPKYKVECNGSSTFNCLDVNNLVNSGRLNVNTLNCNDQIVNLSELTSKFIRASSIKNRNIIHVNKLEASRVNNYEEIKAKTIKSNKFFNYGLLIANNLHNSQKLVNGEKGSISLSQLYIGSVINKYKLTASGNINCQGYLSNSHQGRIETVDMTINGNCTNKGSISSNVIFNCKGKLTNENEINTSNIILTEAINKGKITSSVFDCKNELVNTGEIIGNDISIGSGTNEETIKAKLCLLGNKGQFHNRGNIVTDVIRGALFNYKCISSSGVNNLSITNKGNLYVAGTRNVRFGSVNNNEGTIYLGGNNKSIILNETHFPFLKSIGKIVGLSDIDLSSELLLATSQITCQNKNITLRNVKSSDLIRLLNNISEAEKVTIHSKEDLNLSGNHEFKSINIIEIITSTNFINKGEIKTQNLTITANIIRPGILISSSTLQLKGKNIDIIERNNSIYGAANIIINSENLTVGDFITGTGTENGDTYSRVLSNKNYIASAGFIRVTCTQHVTNRGQIIANNDIDIKSNVQLTNKVGIISSISGDINITAPAILHKRADGTASVNKSERPDYSLLMQYTNPSNLSWHPFIITAIYQYPISGPAILEAAGNISLLGNTTNTASHIICGGKFTVTSGRYIENPLVYGKYTQRPRMTYAAALSCANGQNPNQYHPECTVISLGIPGDIEFYSYYIPNTYVCGCSVRTGSAIQINTGKAVITACMSSKVIHIKSATSATFSNPNKYSTNDISLPSQPNKSAIIHLNKFIKDNVENNPFYQFNGRYLETVLPMGELSLFNGQYLYYNQLMLPNLADLLNPLERINIDPWVRQAMAKITGRVLDTSSPSHVLLSNADDWSKNHGDKKSITREELEKEGNKPMIIYNSNSNEETETLIFVPSGDINRFCSPGDIVAGDSFICETKSDQAYQNNKIITGNSITVTSGGNVTRETGKYLTTRKYCDEGKYIEISQEVAMPQQQFICGQGDINIDVAKNYKVTGSISYAKGNINENIKGFLIKEPLVLHTSYKSEHYESCGFSSSKHIVQEINSANVLPTNTISGENLTESGSNIDLIGVNETAENISYSTDQLNIKPLPIITETNFKERTESSFSSFKSEQKTSTTSFVSSNIRATNEITVSGEKARLCASVSANTFRDNTQDGVNFDIEIGKNNYYSCQTGRTPFSSYDIGKEGYDEVMEQCCLNITKIIITIKKSPIKFNTVIWETPSKIIGTYIESAYILKSYCNEWNHSSQIIPDTVVIIAALVISYFTNGMGASIFNLTGLAGTLASSAFTSLSTHITTNMLRTGDLSATFESIFSKQYGSQFLSTVATSGFSGSTGYSGFVDNLTHHVRRNIISSCINRAILGSKIRVDCMFKDVMINTLGGYLSNKIGDLTYPGEFSNKFCHTILGGILGYVKDGNAGILPGSTGALLSEIIADQLIDNVVIEREVKSEMRKSGTRDKSVYRKLYQEKMEKCVQKSILLTNIIIGLGELTIKSKKSKSILETSIFTSTNCLENNRMMHIPDIPDILDEATIDDMIEEFNIEKKMGKWNEIIEKKKDKYKELPFNPDSSFFDVLEYKLTKYDYEEEIRDAPFHKNRDNDWITVPSTLESMRKLLSRTLNNFSELAHKDLGDYQYHEYLALLSLYAFKGINCLDSLFDYPLERMTKRILSTSKNIGDNIRNMTYYFTNNRSLSQDVGYTIEFLLNKIIETSIGIGIGRNPVKIKYRDISPVTKIPKVKSRKTKIYSTTVDDYSKGSWNIEDIRYSDHVSLYNTGYIERMLPRLKKDKDAPFIICGDGHPRYIRFNKDTPNYNSRFNTKETLFTTWIGEDGRIWISRDMLMDHRMLARYIKSTTDFKGDRAITLFSCTTGAGINSLAQNLANKIGVPVNAPNWEIISRREMLKDKIVIAKRTGWEMLTDTTDKLAQPELGKFITFLPGGGIKAKKNKSKKK